MTNGERFREIFKNVPCGISNDKKFINVWYTEDGYCIIPIEWWNAEYKEPTTKNDLGVDCISRADAIKAMQDKAKKLTNEDTINGLCGAVAILFDLPSVTPIKPKGHWITRPHIYGVAFCSECGFELKINDTNYCPNCGADMREVEP